MRTTASGKGQIGERIKRGEYRLRRTARRRNEGLVELLLACPVKGWFQPLGRTEQSPDPDSAQRPSRPASIS